MIVKPLKYLQFKEKNNYFSACIKEKVKDPAEIARKEIKITMINSSK